MYLSEVIQSESKTFSKFIQRTKLWKKPIASISTFQLVACHKRLLIREGRQIADGTLKAICAEAFLKFVAGEIESCDLVYFNPPKQRMSVSEAASILERFSIEERRAIVFSVSSGLVLDETILLTHCEKLEKVLNDSHYKPIANYIIKTQPVHIRSNFVFWKNSELPSPILDLPVRFESVSGYSWDHFCEELINSRLVNENSKAL